MTDLTDTGLNFFSADYINVLMLLTILAVFSIALYFAKENKAEEFVQFAPSLLIMLGLLGTFFGVVLGLVYFDLNNIQGSIPLLLAGLKTAFATSLAGVFASLLFRILLMTPFFPVVNNQENEFAETLIVTLQDQIGEIRSLKDALVGDDGFSMLNQINMLRKDMNENASTSLSKTQELLEDQKKYLVTSTDRLNLKLQDFANTLSSTATEQVIDALKNVVADFNSHLIEQFGENFAQLNQAVKSLVSWQKNYKTQLTQMSEQYDKSVKSITETEIALAHISENSKTILDAMDVLKEVMTVNRHQLSELERHLGAFKDMRDSAVEAVPEVMRQVEYTLSEISSSVTTVNSHYSQLLSDSDDFIQKYTRTSEDLLTKFASTTEDNIEKVGLRLELSAERIGTNIENASNIFATNTGRTNESFQNMSQHLEVQTEAVTQQLKIMINALNDQVRDILASMTDGAQAINSTMTDANLHLLSDTKEIREQVVGSIDEMQKHLQEVIEHVTSEQHRLSVSTFKTLEKKIADQVAKTGEVVEKQVGILDKAMQEEINHAFKDMGTQLVSLTGRFTEDYKQLTEQMQEVVNRARVL